MNASNLEKLADEMLLKIRRAKAAKPVLLNSLIKSPKISREDVLAALGQIKAWGYKLKLSKNRRISFIAAPDSLTATEISYHLKTKTIGKTIFAYRSVKSTNDIAAGLAEQGKPEGTIVTAEEQTKGKGRFGRGWHSPSQAGIYLSVILKPKFKTERAPGISIMTALALADAISEQCSRAVQIKWPNDILIAEKKAAGILTELSADKNKINHVIVGIGINVNHKAEDFPEYLKKTATSIRMANRKKADRVSLLRLFLVNFEKEYKRYQKNQLSASRKKIRKYSSLMGAQISLSLGKRKITGKVVDIDSTGALILEKEGKRTAVSSGEVTVIKEKQKQRFS